jgi:hypothetical protein
VTLGQLILDLPHRAAHGAEDFLVLLLPRSLKSNNRP